MKAIAKIRSTMFVIRQPVMRNSGLYGAFEKITEIVLTNRTQTEALAKYQ